MAMTDWQEAVQASILGLIFAFMVAKLVSVVFSFRGENLRVERDPAAPSFTIDRELAPADELTAPLASLREEEESEFSGEEFKHSRGLGFSVSGDDEIEKHDDTLSSSSSDSEADSPRQDLVLEAVLFPASERREEEEKAMNAVSDEDLEPEKPKAVDTATFVSDEHALQALTEEGRREETIEKGSEEGNETDDWEGVESSELEEHFGAASTYVASMVTLPGVKPSSEAMLKLYAYYKIATEGPCSTSQPSVLQPTARAKWNAWQKLGNLPQEEAMQCYIAVLTEISPTWHQNSQKGKKPMEEALEEPRGASVSSKMGTGPVFSSLAMSEEGVGEEGTLEAIHACAREGDLQGLGQLLDHGSPVDVKDSDGRTPLIWAADRGELSAVEILLAKGAEINAQDIEGQTALHYATVCEQEAVAKYLFEHGADANIADKEGDTPLKLCPPHWVWMQSSPP